MRGGRGGGGGFMGGYDSWGYGGWGDGSYGPPGPWGGYGGGYGSWGGSWGGDGYGGGGKMAGLTKPMKLSAELADIVGKKEASRAECIKQLWAYLKKNNLQDPENKQFFIPDKKMAKIFGNDKIRAFGMAKFLSAHLS